MENIDNAIPVSPVTQQRTRGHPVRACLGFLAFLRVAIKAARSRRELTHMDAHLWADIGISRGEALMESERKFWDLRNLADLTRRRRGN